MAGREAETGQERPRGRPRHAAVDEAILEATRSILEDPGYTTFSISEVVARSGVSTATIYRRWSSAGELMIAGFRSLIAAAAPIDNGLLARDIEQFLDQLSQALLSVRGLYAADMQRRDLDEQIRREIVGTFVEPRQRQLAEILQRARERGELASLPELEVCWDYIVGPLHHRLLIRGSDLSTEDRRKSVEVALAVLRQLASHSALPDN